MEFDIIKEQILSIEDFDNVDEKLMAQIDKNPEYRRLFEEMRELSALVGSSAPTPEKDGVSLHEAVMERVKKGDVAPRYIDSGFRFPIATAACLLVCIAVVFAARSGIFAKFGASEEALNFASDDADFSVGETAGAGGSAFYGQKSSEEYDAAAEFETADEEYFYVESQAELRTDAPTADTGGAASLAKLPSDGVSGTETYKSKSTALGAAQSDAEPEDGAELPIGGTISAYSKTESAQNGVSAHLTADKADESTEHIAKEYADIVTEKAGDTVGDDAKAAKPETANAVGGGNNGEFWLVRYSEYVGGVVSTVDTCFENYPKYIDSGFAPLLREHTLNGTTEKMPSVMWYLVSEIKPTREQVEHYYETVGITDVPESVYEGLFAQSLEESMQLLKATCAFYHDGCIYTVTDVYEGSLDGTLGFDINADEFDDEWQSCHDMVLEYGGSDEPTELFDFIAENYNKSVGSDTNKY